MEEDQKWKLKREISLGDILMVLAMTLPALWWGSSVESRLAVVQSQIVSQSSRDAAQDATARDGLERIEKELASINRYLREHK